MPIYKVIFAINTIISCAEVDNTVELNGSYYCEYNSSYPMFAIIRAATPADAQKIASEEILSATDRDASR